MYANSYPTCLTSLILQYKFDDAGTNNVNLEETCLIVCDLLEYQAIENEQRNIKGLSYLLYFLSFTN